MSDLEDRYLAMLVVNEIDDSITPLSYPVTVRIPGELFRAVRAGIPGKGLDSLNDAPAIRLGTCCIKLFSSRTLDQQLYSATPFQALNERIEGEALLVLPFGKCGEIVRVLGQGSFYSIVDHIGDRTIRCRGLQT